MTKLFFFLLIFSSLGIAQFVPSPTQTGAGTTLPTYAQAGGTGSPNTQACIAGYPVVQYTASGQTQIYTCGATTANQYGIAPAGTASIPGNTIAANPTGSIAALQGLSYSAIGNLLPNSSLLYTGALPGAVTYPQSQVNGTVARVTDAGIFPDGVTDQTTALNNYFLSVPAGMAIDLPCPTYFSSHYLVSGELTFPGDHKYTMHGSSLGAGECSIQSTYSGDIAFNFVGQKSITLENLSLFSSNSASPPKVIAAFGSSASTGIRGSNIYFDHTYIAGSARKAVVYGIGSEEWTVIDPEWILNGGGAQYVYYTDTDDSLSACSDCSSGLSNTDIRFYGIHFGDFSPTPWTGHVNALVNSTTGGGGGDISFDGGFESCPNDGSAVAQGAAFGTTAGAFGAPVNIEKIRTENCQRFFYANTGTNSIFHTNIGPGNNMSGNGGTGQLYFIDASGTGTWSQSNIIDNSAPSGIGNNFGGGVAQTVILDPTMYTSLTFLQAGSFVLDSVGFSVGPINGYHTQLPGIETAVLTLPPYTITSSAAPAINMSNGSVQAITLSANATATISNISVGSQLSLEICQPSTVYTFTWPAAIHGGSTYVGSLAPNTCLTQTFRSYDGSTLVADNASPTGAAGGALTGTYPNPGISPGSATAATCAGSPGNTTGAYKSQCQATNNGNFYTCNNAAGCSVAADWVGIGTITGVTAGTGLSGGGTSGNVSVTLSTPVSIANGGCNATTAAGCLANLNGVSTAVTTTQALSGPLTAPSVNGNPSVDGTSITSAAWRGSWSNATPYLACNAVSYSGVNYVATSASTNHTPNATGQYWFPALNTNASFTPTQLDCAWYQALGEGFATNTHPSLHLGSAGIYQTCAGLNLGASAIPYVPNLIGEASSSTGGGAALPTTTIQIQTGCGVEAISHQDIPGGTAGLPNFVMRGIKIDANNEASCGDLFAMEKPELDDVACVNAKAGNDHWFGFGDYSNPMGSYNKVADGRVNNFWIVSGGNSVANWATFSVSGATGATTLLTGGTYVNPSPQIVYKGVCTTFPVYAATMSGSGPYSIASITQVSAGVGCSGTVYAQAQDVVNIPYGLKLLASDSTFSKVNVWSAGYSVGMLDGGSNSRWISTHPIGSATQLYEVGAGNIFILTSFDSPTFYTADIRGPSNVIQNSVETWNGNYVGAGGFLFDSNSYNSRVDGVRCTVAQTAGGFSALYNTSGALSTGTQSAQILVGGGSYNDVQSCDATLQSVTAQDSAKISVGTQMQVGIAPPVVTVTPNTTGATTYNYCVAANGPDGVQSSRTCAQITNGSATPNNTVTWAGINNAKSYDVACSIGCSGTGHLAYGVTATTYTDTTGVVLDSVFLSGNQQSGRTCYQIGTNYRCWGLNPTGTLLSLEAQNGSAATGLGSLSLRSTSAPNSDLTGELTFSAATTASYTFADIYTSHPECWAQAQGSTATSGAPYVTYTGATSMTINFPVAFTGNVSYGCIGRN